MSVEQCGHFFREFEVDNDQYTPAHTFDFGMRATGMLIVIDKGKELNWSFNGGKDEHGVLFRNDSFVVFDWFDAQKIWFKKGTNQKIKARVWAWLRQR